MPPIVAVVFDMFETLARNRPRQWEETFHAICQRQGLAVDPKTFWEEWRAIDRQFRCERTNLDAPEKSPTFKSYRQAWQDSFRQVFQKLGLRGDPVAAAQMCVEAMAARVPFEETKPVLQSLAKRWRLALLSNADDDYLLPILRTYGLEFEVVFSSERARAYKPNPLAFRKVLDTLGVPAVQAVYVGDSQFDDVLGSKRVGMVAIWINRNGAAPDPGLPQPDYEIRSLTELPALLESASRR